MKLCLKQIAFSLCVLLLWAAVLVWYSKPVEAVAKCTVSSGQNEPGISASRSVTTTAGI